ncbi:MAG: adenylate/guanylate cyclase domain-containing protein [Polyangiales bacterium]
MSPSQKAEQTNRVSRPLWVRLAALAAVVGVVPLGVAGAFLLDVNGDALRRSAWALQIVIAGDMGRTLGSELHGLDRTLSVVADALRDPALDEDDRIARASEAVTVGPAREVAIYDASGAWVDSITRGQRTMPDDLSGGELFARAPLGDDDSAGSLAARLPLEALRQRSVSLARDHLGGGDVHVVAGDGRVIVGSTDAQNLPLRGVIAADLSAPVSIEEEDFVVTIAPLPAQTPRPWVVVVQTPADVVLAPLARTRTVIFTGLAAAALLAIALAILFARRTVRPITALSLFAADLAARRFERRVPFERNDELGALARDLDFAARALESSEAQIREETAIRLDLGRFLPSELVEKVVEREHAMELGGRRMRISVLFADVVAFTPLAEELPPEQVVSLLNELFTLMSTVVFRHGGTVDKFLGDSVMALFGAPEPQADHAKRALLTAEDMLAYVETASAGWAQKYDVRVQIAIGIASGDAVVGNVGSESRMDYTAIGDVVNIAARLEAIARPGQILATEATRDDAGDAFDFVQVDERTLAGRSSPLVILEVQP